MHGAGGGMNATFHHTFQHIRAHMRADANESCNHNEDSDTQRHTPLQNVARAHARPGRPTQEWEQRKRTYSKNTRQIQRNTAVGSAAQRGNCKIACNADGNSTYMTHELHRVRSCSALANANACAVCMHSALDLSFHRSSIETSTARS